ncbi:MAG: hypothetical protein ABI639_07780 [Thermoanaerobaculia bacterium]
MTRAIRNAALALLAAAAVAAPLVAGPIYLPLALHETDGAYVRNSDLWVTNPDAVTQGFVVRYIAALANGTTRTAGDETGPYYVGAGESKRFSSLVPDGFTGMLEIDGAAILEFNGALTVRNGQGTIVSEAEIPVLTQVDLAAANTKLNLLAWRRSGTTTTTNLGIVNAGAAAAHCTIDVRLRDGLLVVQGVGFDLQPLTLVHFGDALGALGLTTVIEGARAAVTCNQPFWAFSTTYSDQTGNAELYEPTSSIGRSTLIKPVGSSTPGGPTEPGARVYELPGVFLNCNPCDHHKYNMNPGGTYTKIVLDFDFHVGRWDPHNSSGFHNIVWMQNGQSWGNLLAYINSRGSRGNMVFQVNAGVGQEHTQNPGVQLGNDYHIHYEYDLNSHFVSYELRQNGVRRTGAQYPISRSIHEIRPGGFFAGFGGQSAAGPEAATPGWTFSNLKVQFVP